MIQSAIVLPDFGTTEGRTSMKRVSLEELMGHHPQFTYGQQYEYIGNLIAAGRLKPVKNAKTNGKRPALCLSYWRIEEADTSYRELEEELKFHLEPLICVEYYLDHLEEYQNDRSWVLMLNEYLKNNRELLEQPESILQRFKILLPCSFVRNFSRFQISKLRSLTDSGSSIPCSA